LKVLLDTYQNELKQRAEEHELRERLLADLRDVHDRVENARLMIPADKSTVSYAEQMQALAVGEATVVVRVFQLKCSQVANHVRQALRVSIHALRLVRWKIPGALDGLQRDLAADEVLGCTVPAL
jgi:hypothetical protein